MTGIPAVATAYAGTTLKQGSLVLTKCGGSGGYCGTLERPVDASGLVPGTIRVYFEFYRHRAPGPAQGLVVATEGGPGYPATDSRDDYLALLGPLRATRDLLIMDNRGTGRSHAINCVPLQTSETITTTDVGECGRSLGEAAALFGTAQAVDDLAAVLAALHAPHVDLYGDSYGTIFVQVFAARHPDLLRSALLDGAYPVYARDGAWYPTYAPAASDKFTRVCERSAACRNLGGTTLARISAALDLVRRVPKVATAADADGRMTRFQVDASRFATVMFAASPRRASLRELDAASRAYVTGDELPLLRLMAEASATVDSRDPTRDPGKFSLGQSVAVMCVDAQQIYDMALPVPARIAQRDRVLAERRASFPGTYAPFTIDEYRGMPLDYSFLDECVEWPVTVTHPPAPVVAPEGHLPDVPALVVSGELDNMTTVADGAAAAGLFPHGQQVVLANSFHVNALPRGRTSCASEIVRHFIRTLSIGDTRCTQQVPAPTVLAAFARRVAELDPPVPRLGNDADTGELRAARAAVLTAADAIGRAESNTRGTGVGLRGGRFAITSIPDGALITMDAMRFTEDVAVSGLVRIAARGGRTQARLRWTDGTGNGHAEVVWDDLRPEHPVVLRGAAGGRRLIAEMAVP